MVRRLAQGEGGETEQREEGRRRGERSAGAEGAGEHAADRRAEADAEDDRSARHAHRARPPRPLGAIGDHRHRGRPAGDRERALDEAEREQRPDRVDGEVAGVERGAAEEAEDEEGAAPAEPIRSEPPERGGEQIGRHLDGEEERRVADVAAELVDHELLQPGHDQGQVEHRAEQQRAGEQQRRGGCGRRVGGRRGGDGHGALRLRRRGGG